MSKQMQEYFSHKKILAAKIVEVQMSTVTGAARLVFEDEDAVNVDEEYMLKHKPFVGGYFIIYQDGYSSFSPAEAFESGYTKMPHSIRQINDHKVNECNEQIEIFATDLPGAGGANHRYEISGFSILDNPSRQTGDNTGILNILFQNGPIKESGVNGITQEVLLAIVADRLRSFQEGPYACKENAGALDAVESAQRILHSRTKQRVERGVEGTHEK